MAALAYTGVCCLRSKEEEKEYISCLEKKKKKKWTKDEKYDFQAT